jgi:hypothetical protein
VSPKPSVVFVADQEWQQQHQLFMCVCGSRLPLVVGGPQPFKSDQAFRPFCCTLMAAAAVPMCP